MGFRFIHAADLHLDTPFQGIGRVSEEVAASLRDASLDAFDKIVRAAIEHEVAFVLFAGDIYDGEQRGVRAQLRFLQGLERLSRRGIRSFIVHGNHDPIGGWSAVRQWPPEVTIFGPDDVVGVPVEVGGERIATVFGISYDRREVSENLALRFPRGREAGASGFCIGLLHCTLGSQPEHSSYAPCSSADLSAAAIDYWALGHIHRREIVGEGRPWGGYPGNTPGRRPKPSELGPKGLVLVDVRGDEVHSAEFVATDSVRFLNLELDISRLGEDADLGTLRNELMSGAQELRSHNSGISLVVRATLRGRGRLHATLATGNCREDLLRELRDGFAESEPPIWWDDLRDETRPEVDLNVVRARDDFTASLVKRAEAYMSDPQQLERLRALLVPQSPSELSRRCGAPADGVLIELLESAMMLSVESLEEESSACA
jgi:DNA repair protein SbcD/Mre11